VTTHSRGAPSCALIYCVVFFSIKDALLLSKAITSSLYITRMHTTVLSVSSSKKEKKLGKIHIEAIKHMTPKKWVGLQSVDYAATHVGKKYPSTYPPTVYRPCLARQDGTPHRSYHHLKTLGSTALRNGRAALLERCLNPCEKEKNGLI
jgi:hypothetical protein